MKKKKTVESESQVLHDADEYLQDFQSGVMPLPNVAEFCLKYGHDYNMMISKNSWDFDMIKAKTKILLTAKNKLEPLVLLELNGSLTDKNGKKFRIDKRGVLQKLREINKELED